MIRPQFYGWHDPRKGYLVSRQPPDAPVRPSTAFDTASEVMAMIERKRGKIMWWPPLPDGTLS